MEPVDAVLAAGIEQDARADDIRLQEDFRILDRAVDVALRCKVDDDVRLFRLEDPVDGPAVGDVRADELELILFSAAESVSRFPAYVSLSRQMILSSGCFLSS